MIRLLLTRAAQVGVAVTLVRRLAGSLGSKPEPTKAQPKPEPVKPARRRPPPHRSREAGKDAS